MTLTIHEPTHRDNTLNITVTDKLTSEDYATLGVRVQEKVDRHGRVNLLFELNDFNGWTEATGVLWEDLELDVKQFNHIDRVAIVGHSRWKEQMDRLYEPFISAIVRVFPETELAEAKAWLNKE